MEKVSDSKTKPCSLQCVTSLVGTLHDPSSMQTVVLVIAKQELAL